ncbi:MAG: fibronectin type III domain-containing protein [Bacteroidales bacterium]|nr:fibronectin type III domain-containing protein [Bacteroidales bacterium]
MKKILFGLAICMLSQIALAQKATDYKFTSTVQAPYEPLPETAVTLAGSTKLRGTDFKTTFFNEDTEFNYSTSNSVENYATVPMDGIPIGFDFAFADMVCDKFVAAGTGFIFLAPKTDEQVKITGLASGSMIAKWFPTIGIGVGSTGGNASGIEGTAIRYLLQGEAGNRTLTVEYANVSYTDNDHPFNFQIKLHEKNSEIELIFDGFTIPNTGAWTVGFTAKETDHFHLKPTNEQWDQATRISNTSAFAYANDIRNSIFPEGLHYRFTPPAALPPADVAITGISDTEITLSVTPNAKGDNILLVLTDQFQRNTFPWSPVVGQAEDGKTYGVGDSLYVIGQDGQPQQFGGRVIYNGSADNPIICRPDGLQGNTLYYCAAFSYNEDHVYSSSYVSDDTVSPAGLPFYEGFNTMRNDNALQTRWPGTQNFSPGSCGGSEYVAQAYTYPSANEATLVFPAMTYPENLNLRLTLNYHMSWHASPNWDEKNLTAADWADHDSIVIEYSIDEGQTFHYAGNCITKQNAPDFTGTMEKMNLVFLQQNLRIPNFGGGKALLRLRYVSEDGKEGREGVYLNINDIYLSAVDLCDYPALVAVDDTSIVKDRAVVRWMAGDNNETVWNMKTEIREADGQWHAWGSTHEVNGSSYQLENLTSNCKYRVSLQAVCGTGSLSRWVSTEFHSGWTTAFLEDFNELEAQYPNGVFTQFDMPAHWAVSRDGSSSRKPDSITAHHTDSKYEVIGPWKRYKSHFPVLEADNKAICLPFYHFVGTTALRLPTANIQPGQKPRLVFDYAYGLLNEDSGELMGPYYQMDILDQMYLWISTDTRTEKFAFDDTVRCWKFEDLRGQEEGTVSFDLSSYSGDVSVVIGTYAWDSPHVLFLDNIGIVYDCPAAQLLALQAGSLNETSAALNWRSDPTHDTWTVIRRDNGTEITETVTGTDIRWDNLKPATTYTVLVGQPCADTADWSHIRFTTGGMPCHIVDNISVSAVGQRNATLNWTGEAEKYRIRIRPVAGTPETATAWTIYESTGTTYTFSNLTPDTDYEGAIQSVCGEAVGDTAAYVAFENFKTAGITCFAPTEIKTGAITHWTATVSWQGEAADYEIEYRREGTLDILARHSSAANEYRLENLNADTRYEVRLRSICSAGDTSVWSTFIGFATATAPECAEPTDLKTEAITLNSARLSWTAGEEQTGFIVRYSTSSPISWDSVRDITDSHYELTDLKPETIYLWTVMSACRGGQYSNWVLRQSFKTEGTANEGVDERQFDIYADKGQIHILNRAALPIERIRVYDVQGRLIHDFIVRTNDNAILTTNRHHCMTVVEIESEGQFLRYKVLLP